MARSLWKLWLVTTCAWSLFSMDLVVPAFQNGVFLAHLVNPKYQEEPIIMPSDWGVDLLRNMQAVLHSADLVDRLQVPFACKESELKDNGPCWGTAQEARRKLSRDGAESDEDEIASQAPSNSLKDRQLLEQQYSAFDRWQSEVPGFTQFGIAVIVILVCLRGPLVTLLVGLVAFALVRRAVNDTQVTAVN